MSAAEARGKQGQLEATADAGLEALSREQEITFTLYEKFVFAQDGFVFWVATPQTMRVKGSFHYATDRAQDEDQTIGANQVIFTAEEEVAAFNSLAPTSMWIGAWRGEDGQPPLQVVFGQRGAYYRESDVWHYSGFAVFPALSAQIVASEDDLPSGPIVSNSLPIWLAQTSYNGNTVQVYPSFLVPDNITPPYVVAHVEPSRTEALGAFPIIGPWPGTTIPNSGASPLSYVGSSQLMRDEVSLTLYGFTNELATQYLVALIEYSYGTDAFGFSNSPAIVDEKRPQVEIAAIAMKKTITISATYYTSTADAIARRLILSAAVTTATAAFP